MKKRIWELDAFRGICIIGVVIVHLIFDMVNLYPILDWQYPAWFFFLKQWGGTVFLVLSGICVTLGSRSVRRGIIVFCAGMICTAATWAMTRVGFDSSIIIYFGALHCLGVCMMLWPLLRKLPTFSLFAIGLSVVVAGYRFASIRIGVDWLFPLGLVGHNFSSSDFFPLLPHLGWFLLGACLGRTLYREKKSLLPNFPSDNILVRFFRWCGTHSLWIYLIHQPVLYLIVSLL